MSMDIKYIIRGHLFIWDSAKAGTNLKKHGVSFEEACEVFFFPYYEMEDASVDEEQRWALIGYSRRGSLLHVVAVEQADAAWRIISAREVTATERNRYEKENDT